AAPRLGAHRRNRRVPGQDGRRDGGAHRRLRRPPDDLRHGEGRRPRHDLAGHPPGGEARRQVRRIRPQAALIVRLLRAAGAVILALAAGCAQWPEGSYRNPVLARDFPDPAALRAPDGWTYAYATRSVHDGRTYHIQV